MKLSMWTINDYLTKEGFVTEYNISGGLPCISIVQLSNERTYSSKYAELIKSGEDCLLVNDMDTVLIKNCDILDAANSINNCIEYYNKWEMSLYEAMLHSASLQEMLDLADVIFGRPMFIKNDSTRTFAITKGYPNSIHPHWDKIVASLEQGTPDYDVVRVVSQDPEFRNAFLERYPSIRWSPAYENLVLHTNIFVNERRVAEVVMLENNIPFNKGEVHLMSTFAEIIEKYVSLNSSIFQSGSDVTVFLTQLLEGETLDKEQLLTICKYIGLEPDSEFCLLVASNLGLFDSPILSALREKLEIQLKDAIVVPLKGQIVVLVGVHGRKYNEIIEDFKHHIPKEGFCWALTYEFNNINNVPLYYDQACNLLKTAVFKKENYITMYERAAHFISQACREIENSKTLVHPDLLRLEAVDIDENTQYCETLFYFLLCGGNYTDASKIMMLHRNTMIYRMNKIREIVQMNIDDADNRRLMLYSYMILGKDY